MSRANQIRDTDSCGREPSNFRLQPPAQNAAAEPAR
jgi:hypothetical protein